MRGRPDEEAPALQLACYWGNALLGVSQHRRLETVRVGPTPRCALRFGPRERALVQPLDGRFALHVDASLRAGRRRGAREEALAPGLHPLEPGDLAWAESGGLRLEASLVPPAEPARAAPLSALDLRLVNLLLALGFVAGALAVAAETRQEADLLADDLGGVRIALRYLPPPPERAPAPPRSDALGLALDNPAPEPAAAARGPEGEAGERGAERAPGRRGVTLNLAPGERLADSGLLADLGAAGARLLRGGAGLGGELHAALSGLEGPAVSALPGGGFGGLGLRGTEPGGGGETQTFRIGHVFSRGRSGGEPGYGTVPELSRDTRPRPPPRIADGPVDSGGALDRELVRQVIRSHVSQIRFCYEQRLARSPGLSGKVRVRFTVGPSGSVTEAAIAEDTTIPDPELRSCVLSRVRSWLFPAPKGGGSAIVLYPFWLRPSGE